MSIKPLSFEELAKEENIDFVYDSEANTVLIDDLGTIDLSIFVEMVMRYSYQINAAKISIKVNESQAIYFFQHGFKVEASIMAYYGLQDAFYVVYYLDDKHHKNHLATIHDKVLEKAYISRKNKVTDFSFDRVTVGTNTVRTNVESKDKLVFTGREHSIADHDTHHKFFAQSNDKIVATATASYDESQQVVEFSDFIVSAEFDVWQLLINLITEMEQHFKALKCTTAFTIVPASSLAINAICVEQGFEFGGRLKNESLVDGELDSLNTWFKRL